jgi:hypothetical protein
MRIFKYELVISIFASLLLAVYFFFIHVNELSNVIYLRLLNGVIVMLAVNEAIRMNVTRRKFGYATSLLTGVKVSGITVLISVVMLASYFSIFGVSDAILSSAIVPVTGATQFIALILLEGVSAGVVISFALMQYWKNRRFSPRRGFYLKEDTL